MPKKGKKRKKHQTRPSSWIKERMKHWSWGNSGNVQAIHAILDYLDKREGFEYRSDYEIEKEKGGVA